MRTSREAICSEVEQDGRFAEAAALPVAQELDDEGELDLPELGSFSDLALLAALMMPLILVVWIVWRLL